jgi:hypothetical protein
MAPILALLAAVSLLLLPDARSWAGEATWRHQIRRGAATAGTIRRHRPVREHRRRAERAPGATARAQRTMRRPGLFHVRLDRLGLSPPPLVARPGRLRRESDAARRDRLSRMRDMAMVERFRRIGLLVRVPAQARTYYVAGVRGSLRVVRPWTKYFIEQVSHTFHCLFDQRLRITSLTRTPDLQRLLLRTNLGAAPVQGAVQSTHLTGAAFDMSKRALSRRQVAWLRTVLAKLSRRGLIHVVEEFQEPHFHVMVTRRYGQYGNAADETQPGGRTVRDAGGC